MLSGEEIAFSGTDGRECEEFVRAIHKAAYAAGKLRDGAWMADVAVTCLSGRALRYYTSLEPEVQCDWRLLSAALLERYPPPDGDEDGMQVGSSSIPRVLPLVGPQCPQLNARIGRIKVIGANSEDFGYLGDGDTYYTKTNGNGAGASVTEAIRVSYAPANRFYEIEIQGSNEKSEVLGLHWRQSSPSTAVGSLDYATITPFNYEGLYRSSTLNWAGPGYTRIWNVMADSTLCPYLEEYGSRKPLQFFLYKLSGYRWHAVDVAADAGAFATTYHGGWTLVTLLFEPIVQSPEGRSADEA